MTGYLWGVGSGVVLSGAAQWAWHHRANLSPVFAHWWRELDLWGKVLRGWSTLRHKLWGDP